MSGFGCVICEGDRWGTRTAHALLSGITHDSDSDVSGTRGLQLPWLPVGADSGFSSAVAPPFSGVPPSWADSSKLEENKLMSDPPLPPVSGGSSKDPRHWTLEHALQALKRAPAPS